MRTRSSEKAASASARAEADRRVAARHPIEIPIELSTKTEMLIHVTANLSATGAFFKRAIPYKVGTRLMLRILLPGDAPVKCEGIVASIPNSKDFGMGVQFIEISKDDQKRIEELKSLFGTDVCRLEQDQTELGAREKAHRLGGVGSVCSCD